MKRASLLRARRGSWSFAPLSLGITILAACSQPSPTPTEEPIRVAAANHPFAALLCIAEREQFFAAAGLKAEIVWTDTGWQSIERLRSDAADFAVVSTFTFARSLTTSRKPDRILAETYAGPMELTMASLVGGPITRAKDLEGRRVGVLRVISLEATMDAYFTSEGVNPKKVTLVEGSSEVLVNQLVRGKLDAILALEPMSSLIEAAVPREKLQTLRFIQAPVIQILLAHGSKIQGDLEPHRRVLRALIAAETRIDADADGALKHLGHCFPKFSIASLKKFRDGAGFRVLAGEQLRFHYSQATDWVKRSAGTYDRMPPTFEEVFTRSVLASVQAPRVLMQ